MSNTGNFLIRCANDLVRAPGAFPNFVNSGYLDRSGAGNNFISPKFENRGALKLFQGHLEFMQSGTQTLAVATTFLANGTTLEFATIGTT